jgi:hypothetical protein
MQRKLALTAIGIVTATSLLPLLPQKASAQIAEEYAANLVAICNQLNSGKSILQISSEWVVHVDSLIAANQFLTEADRATAHQFFGQLLVDSVYNYCPEQTQALVDAQSAATAASYQPPASTCNFSNLPISPNNNAYVNAGNAWGNWFNDFGGRWMPGITGQTTQEIYGC